MNTIDKQELIDRLNAIHEAIRQKARKTAMGYIRELTRELKTKDVSTRLHIDREPIVSQVARAMSSSHVEEENQAGLDVDHFLEWVNTEEPRFPSKDFTIENPKLHELYTGWAHKHLLVINEALNQLEGFSNGNLIDITMAMQKCRKDLILSNAAYRDAAARIVARVEPPEDEGYQTDMMVEDSLPTITAIRELIEGHGDTFRGTHPNVLAQTLEKIKEIVS